MTVEEGQTMTLNMILITNVKDSCYNSSREKKNKIKDSLYKHIKMCKGNILYTVKLHLHALASYSIAVTNTTSTQYHSEDHFLSASFASKNTKQKKKRHLGVALSSVVIFAPHLNSRARIKFIIGKKVAGCFRKITSTPLPIRTKLAHRTPKPCVCSLA